MVRQKTSILLIEPNETIAATLAGIFAKHRVHCEINCSFDFSDFTADDARIFTAYSGLLVGSVENQEQIIETLRSAGCQKPILALLDHRASELAVRLLAAGYDDVQVKPINPTEVMARISAITRRGFGHSAGKLQIGVITAYFDGRDPELNGQRVKLSHREHTIFTQLALRAGKVVSKDAIYDAVYGMLDSQPFDKVVDVYICKLRKKLAHHTGGLEYIETVYGRGYKLEAPAEHLAPDAEHAPAA